MTRAVEIRRCRAALLRGELALVPTDTVYGLAAALDDPAAVEALYAVKNRPRSQPCQILIYNRQLLRTAIDALPLAVAAVARDLLPGTTTVIVADGDGRYAPASGGTGSVGIRAPSMPDGFQQIDVPLIATSANDPGGADPRSLSEIPGRLRSAAGAEIDLGELPGVASAVVDLRTPGRAALVRPGPDPSALVARIRLLGLDIDGAD